MTTNSHRPKDPFPISIAPMMEWTDRHYRVFMRRITEKTLLYTEMVTTSAILRGDRKRFLDFDPIEKPLILQLGGDNPEDLAECSKIAEDFGYDGVNLNVGCPSDRVRDGHFGACLMAKPDLVRSCTEAMKSAVSIPVSVKHRIGINGLESYENLKNFIQVVSQSGIRDFTIHARIAVLGGLSPAQNRTIPPLRYEDVFQIKKEFPSLRIEINGGIRDLDIAGSLLEKVDAVMIGRAAYEIPYLFAGVDERFYFHSRPCPSRKEVMISMIPYLEEHISKGGKIHHVLRHTMGLFHGLPGGKYYRRKLTETMYSEFPSVKFLLDSAMEKVD